VKPWTRLAAIAIWVSSITTVAMGAWMTALPVFAYLAASAQLSDIQERGYIVVGVKDNLRPLGFQDASGELVGLEIDVAHRLALELLGDETAVVFQPLRNADRLSALLNGDVDMVIANLTRTHTRSRIVSFSVPYYLDGTAFVTRDPTIQTLPQAARSPIAVLNNSSTIAILRSYLNAPPLVGVDSYQDALALLDQGQVASFAGDASVLAGWVQDHPSYRLLPTLLSSDSLSVAMPRGNQYDDLRRRVNEAIARWYDEGWIQERVDYWGLPQ
jgi:polar amino acid transport system substrate-binding protein